jgi:pimeloyl-ACP methyl ester carboxylesterase
MNDHPEHHRDPRHGTPKTLDRRLGQPDAGSRMPSPRTIPSALRRPLWAVALLGTLAACGSGPSVAHETTTTAAVASTTIAAPTTSTTPTTSAAPTPPTGPSVATSRALPDPPAVPRPSADFDQFATVRGARMHVRCVGSGAATVVLIAGFGDGGEHWGPIEGPIAHGARVCSYARFGTGTSDPPPDVQTFRSQATDLHTALDAVGEPGPYVVVGHSFGGAEAVAFSSMYPGEVHGLMLLDASPTTWPAAACAVPDDGSDTAHNFQQICSLTQNPNSNPERLDIPAAFADVATITSLGALPTVVVTAGARTLPGLDPAETARLNDVWNQGQQHWTSLSTVGRVVPVADTSHYIQLDQPAIVINQIQHLLAASTTPASATTTTAPSTNPTTDRTGHGS